MTCRISRVQQIVTILPARIWFAVQREEISQFCELENFYFVLWFDEWVDKRVGKWDQHCRVCVHEEFAQRDRKNFYCVTIKRLQVEQWLRRHRQQEFPIERNLLVSSSLSIFVKRDSEPQTRKHRQVMRQIHESMKKTQIIQKSKRKMFWDPKSKN